MASLAAQLWQARCTGTFVDPAGIEAPKDLAEAYAVQGEINGSVRGAGAGSSAIR